MAQAAVAQDLLSLYQDQHWRLNNLYCIKDKQGNLVRFRCNWAQQYLWENQHTLNLILKARQLGCTTYIDLLALDNTLWNDHYNAGIIAHHKDDASHIFAEKILLPFSKLCEVSPDFRRLWKTDSESRHELSFQSTGSKIRVGTSLRSGTFQFLHISEYGIACARYPHKAREIKEGALNTVAQGQTAYIESTAKGRGGHFYDLVQHARELMDLGEALAPMDWRLFFFPWQEHPEYRDTRPIEITPQQGEHFDRLVQEHGVILEPEQKYWYLRKLQDQGPDAMRQEYPTTIDEAFEAATEAAYFSKELALARRERRVVDVPFDPSLPVHTTWDLGIDDYTVIWFFQANGAWFDFIDYYEASGLGLSHYVNLLEDWRNKRGYLYRTHYGPHDITHRDWTSGEVRRQTAAGMGINFTVVPREENLADGIEAARQFITRCRFDRARCAQGLSHLENYRREWNEHLGCHIDRPIHDEASHAADSFRNLARAYKLGISPDVTTMSPEQARALRERFQRG